jgi:hypothetical protein
MRVLVGLAIASVLLAGGCRQSDEKVKAELRTQMMQRCTTDIAPQAAAVPGFDTAAFCTCVTDKAIGDRSIAELKKLFEDKAGTAAQGRQAGTECLNQQMPASMTADAGAANAARPAAVPPAAASPAAPPDPAAEAAEEEPVETSEEDAVEDSQ